MTATPKPFEPAARQLVTDKVQRHQQWRALTATSALFHAAVPCIVVEVAELYDILFADRHLTTYQRDRIVNDYAHRRLTDAAEGAEQTRIAHEAALAEYEANHEARRQHLLREFL